MKFFDFQCIISQWRKDITSRIYQNGRTVFTLTELAQLFPGFSSVSLRNRLYYAVKTKKLVRPRRGIYAQENYNIFELANKVYTPSYISLETVLQKEGIIFQDYSTIFLVSYLTREIEVDGKAISYRKLKNEVLYEKAGILQENYYSIATPERAFLDALLLYKDYHFDNLGPLDWDKVENLKKLYFSPALEKRVEEYFRDYQSRNVKP